MSLLSGTAFITGAASGIGQQTALTFARHGVQRLALADVNTEALEAANGELARQFPAVEILALRIDVRKVDEVRAGVAAAVARFGRIDVAVNNAGITGRGKATHEIEDEAGGDNDFLRVVDVDLHGVWRCQREELKAMVKQDDLGGRTGRGTIVNVASMYGLVVPPDMAQTAYSTAKHGVVGLTKGDAVTYAPHQIRINAVCPGFTETPMLKYSLTLSTPIVSGVDRTPMKRLGTIEEISDAITFLASSMSSFMTGATLVADGGYTSV